MAVAVVAARASLKEDHQQCREVTVVVERLAKNTAAHLLLPCSSWPLWREIHLVNCLRCCRRGCRLGCYCGLLRPATMSHLLQSSDSRFHSMMMCSLQSTFYSEDLIIFRVFLFVVVDYFLGRVFIFLFCVLVRARMIFVNPRQSQDLVSL